MERELPHHHCRTRTPVAREKRERGVLLVVALTAVMMVVEIAVGTWTESMALLADGWHMATHVGALGLASVAYAVSRRYANHQAFTFGTGKISALAGYTSACSLGVVALVMLGESVRRFFEPHEIDFASSLPVAVLGLLVNVASVLLLHTHDDHHDGQQQMKHDEHHDEEHHPEAHRHDGHHDHDHNHRAALMHVIADTLTSALAIGALLAGRYLGWVWLDPASGVVGGLVILKWGLGLAKHAAGELVDVVPSPGIEREVQAALEAMGHVSVADLHVWPLGSGRRSCVVTVRSNALKDPNAYRAALARFRLTHLTVEVQDDRGLSADSEPELSTRSGSHNPRPATNS